MKTKYFKETKAITLIALIVSIIVLLILAGVSIAVLTGENGILNRATSAKTTNEQKTAEEELKLGVSALSIDYRKNTTNSQTFREFVTSNSGANLKTAMGLATDNQDLVVENATNGVVSYKGQKYQVDNYGGVVEYVPGWEQNGTTVTKGNVTLNVGSEVSGYVVTVGQTTIGDGDNKWFVLGAEDGKLLITTNKSYEKVQLSGIEDYLGGGITKLNNATTKYKDANNLASDARTLKYEDINRITGFNPAVDGSNDGQVYEYGNQVTYTKVDNELGYLYIYIGYVGTEQPTSPKLSDIKNFTYWNGTELVDLGIGESTTLTCTYASYSGSSLDPSIRAMLFTNTGNYPVDEGAYWLGSQCVVCREGRVNFGLHSVFGSQVGSPDMPLFASDHGAGSLNLGLRPVVTLASDVNVTSEGAISK